MKRFLFTLVLLAGLTSLCDTGAQEPPAVTDEIPTIWLDENELENPGINVIDTGEMDWASIWRSSDQPGEKRTIYSPDDWQVRPKGKRIGCICMDGEEEKNKGRGACSGRGGVRYWIYESPEGKEIHHPTARHLRHPDPLATEEKEALAAYNEDPDDDGPPLGGGWGGGTMNGFVNLAIILATSMLVVFFIRQFQQPKQKVERKKKARSPRKLKERKKAAEIKPDKKKEEDEMMLKAVNPAEEKVETPASLSSTTQQQVS